MRGRRSEGERGQGWPSAELGLRGLARACFGIIAIDAKTKDSRETETRFFLAEEGAVSRFRKANGGRVGQMKNEE